MNGPYYLECLQGIARGRKSEDLQTKAAIEASSGKVSRSDIKAAYNEFGLDFRGPFLDDDTIIGNFQSRIADAPRQEADLRRALSIIGTDRGSSRIQHIASNSKCSSGDILPRIDLDAARRSHPLIQPSSCHYLRASVSVARCYGGYG